MSGTKRQVKLPLATVKQYLNKLEVFGVHYNGEIPLAHHSEICFLMAAAMYGKALYGVTGRSCPGWAAIDFGNGHSHSFFVNKHNVAVF